MNYGHHSIGLVLVISFLSLASGGSSSQCASMIGTPLQRCSVAGYNSTFPMPFKLSNATKDWVSIFLDFVLTLTESSNCSIGLDKLGYMVICGLYVPKCNEGRLLLPCKRVCNEYYKRCTGHVDPFWFDYFIAHCVLLPDQKASSGKCFEPPNFDEKFNSTVGSDILHGKCHKLIFPWCKGHGYHYTIMKEKTQINYYKHLYGKPFTNTSADNIAKNSSNINYWLNLQRNYSNCAIDIQKTLCADLFPPCYPHEGTAMYGVCSEVCLDMRTRCPSLGDHPTHLGNFFTTCENWATGSSAHGYCKRTSWPTPLSWLTYFKERLPKPRPAKPTPSPPTPAYIIVLAVIIPLILVALVIAAVFVWRQRKLPWFVSKFRPGEDTKDIVQDEVPNKFPVDENPKMAT